MSLATVEAIRDRAYSLLEAIVPTTDSGTRLRRYRNEWGANFEDAAEKHAAAAFRRVQVRETASAPPDVSNFQYEGVEVTLRVSIAYPQTHIYGANNAMDRDDVLNQDWLKVNYALGWYGRGNFTTASDGSYDCTPLGAEMVRETGDKVDFLVVTARFRFIRDIA